MKLVLAFLAATMALGLSYNAALANELQMLELEGIALQMTETQVRAAMKTKGYTYAGKVEDETLDRFPNFEGLVAAKKSNPERFRIYHSSAELRYEGVQGHLLIRFMPFKNQTVVTAVTLYAIDVPSLFRGMPDCKGFAERSWKHYGIDKSVARKNYASWHAPMIVNGQMKEDGQQMGTNCSPRFSATVNLYNPHARDLIMRQIDQALSE